VRWRAGIESVSCVPGPGPGALGGLAASWLSGEPWAHSSLIAGARQQVVVLMGSEINRFLG